MKRNLLIGMMFVATAGFAVAQNGYVPTTDVLGAHLNYGRGCAACHAPHSGAYGNGNAATADPTSGAVALWGEDVASLSGKTFTTAGGVSETLPTMAATTPDVSGLLTCLSCHDGSYATGAMMRNAVYESLPPTYGTKNVIPTLFSNASNGHAAGDYINDHPAGLGAVFGCNTSKTQTGYIESGHNWDCVITPTTTSTGAASFTLTAGPNMQQFIQNYGFFVSLGNYAGTPVVVCTTCHNQHLMNVVAVTNKAGLETTPGSSGAVVSTGTSGLPAGNYATMFFIRAPYNPANGYANSGTGSAGSNQTAQFCRQCHGGESNEMNGGTAGTTF